VNIFKDHETVSAMKESNPLPRSWPARRIHHCLDDGFIDGITESGKHHPMRARDPKE
jgi:hypothetical protein